MMKNRKLKTALYVVAGGSLLVLSLLIWSLQSQTHGSYYLTILHTNDLHGHVWKFKDGDQEEIGGLAAQATIIKQIRSQVRKEGGHVLLLSAGDVNTGQPESDLLFGEPAFRGMGFLGYDAMALGNHEFDVPRDILLRQKKWGGFPFVSANVVKIGGKKEILADPYIVKELGDLKVLILGLTTPETPSIALPQSVAGLSFEDPVQAARDVIAQFKSHTAGDDSLIIVLSHLGYYTDPANRIFGGDMTLAEGSPDIDVIVGGHSHTALSEPVQVGKTTIVQAGEYGKYIGRLNLIYRHGEITRKTYKLIPINYDSQDKIIPDAETMTFLQPLLDRSQKELNQKVGSSESELIGVRERVRGEETNLGNLVCDLMRERMGADIAIQNGGGIRASIPAGDVSMRDILSAFPFRNSVVAFSMTGAEILDLFKQAASKPARDGGFLQVSGVLLKIDRTKGTLESIHLANGDAIIPVQNYRVVTNSFLAQGGDGYAMLASIPNKVDSGLQLSYLLREHFLKTKTVRAQVDGRIIQD